MRKLLEKTLLAILSDVMAKKARKAELLPKYKLTSKSPLTKEQKALVNRTWGELTTVKDFRSWELYKSQAGFNPYFVPDDIFVSSIIRVLNPIRKCYCLQNKNMYPLIYPGLSMPSVYASSIDGVIYAPDGSTIATTTLKHIIPFEKAPIIKPSSDTCSGQGVKRICSAEELYQSISAIGSNFVIQEYLEQSKITSRFNPSSLNTFRVNTLYIYGRISTVNIMFRHGQNKALVDNAGAGGVFCGVETDGHFIGKSLDGRLKQHEITAFGEKYSDLYIPKVTEICHYVEAAHLKYLPMMGHVAWDVALDKDSRPVVIEINLGWPGILTEQLSSSRPIYGSRTQEVIEFAIKNKSLTSFIDFLGHWT